MQVIEKMGKVTLTSEERRVYDLFMADRNSIDWEEREMIIRRIKKIFGWNIK